MRTLKALFIDARWRSDAFLVLPALVWLGVLAVVAVAVGLLVGAVAALWLIAGVLAVMVAVHLVYLSKLGAWLEAPDSDSIPGGVGSWVGVFARLYRARRASERNERQLIESEQRFRRTISALPDGIVLIDTSLQIEWCNPMAALHLGINLAADQGLRITNLVRDPPFVAYMTSMRFSEPLTLRPLADPKRVVQIRVVEFEPERSILVTRDVTHNERIDAMRRDFIANVSHELRTPLTVISGFLETLLDNDVTAHDVRHHHLTLMQEQAQRMNRLIADLLMLSRLESEDRVGLEEQIDMAQLLSALAEEAQALSRGKHHIRVEHGPGQLLGARDELRSAFSNLVSNAIRYTPAGGEISLRWRVDDEGGQFDVEDNGIGIAAEHVPRLTERFYRVDKSRSRETGGTGLGLAIVKHVLMRHDARLDVASTVGSGSRFSARFARTRLRGDSA